MKRFWKILISNAPLKVLAFCFACLLYAILHDGSNVTVTLPHVPVTFRVPDTLCPPDGNYEVSLQVKGSYREIMKIRERRIEGEVKLSPNLKTARHEISLDAADFKIPEVEVVKITPAYLEVPIQRRISRILPVKVQLSGVPAERYRVGTVTVSPDKVEVMGPEFAVEALKQIKTAEISVKGENSDFGKENVELAAIGKEVVVKPSSVNVNVQIRRRLNRSRTFSRIPVRYLCSFGGKSTSQNMIFSNPEPQSVEVEVTGPDHDIQQLADEDIQLFVNLTAVDSTKNGEFAFPVEHLAVRDFPDVKIIRVTPQKIKVKCTKNEGFLWKH